MKFPTKYHLTRQHFIWLQTLLNSQVMLFKNNGNRARLYMFFFNNFLMTYFVVHTPLQIADENDFKNVHGIFVRKKGKSTGITEGILVSGLFTIGISRIVSPKIYRFDYCYRIIDKPGVRKFFEPGDSGSGVYLIDKRGKKKPLGIAFARSIYGDTVACRIENVTRAFDLSLNDEEGPVTEPMEVDVEPMEVNVDFGAMFEMLELMDIS